MPYVVTEPCIDVMDRSCVQTCPVDCIYEGRRMLYIHPDECVDCGACEPVCPQNAISFEEEISDEMIHYVEINASFTRENASGSATTAGPIGFDHAQVTAHS